MISGLSGYNLYNMGGTNGIFSSIKAVKAIAKRNIDDQELASLNNLDEKAGGSGDINLANVVAYPVISSDNLFQAFTASDNNLNNFDENELKNKQKRPDNEELDNDGGIVSDVIGEDEVSVVDGKSFREYLEPNISQVAKTTNNIINNQIINNHSLGNTSISNIVNKYQTMFEFDININPNISYLHDSLNRVDVAV